MGCRPSYFAGTASFAATVNAARGSLRPATLEIDLEARLVRAAGREFNLPPADSPC